MSTRVAILASWRASRRQSDVTGAVTMTAPAFAGYALEAAEGDVETARLLVPTGAEAFWGRVHAALDDVQAEESSPLRAAGGHRP